MTKWTVKNKKILPGSAEKISKILGVTPLAAVAMLNRGLKSIEEMQRYKNVSVDSLHSLAGIKGVKKAFGIISAALEKHIPVTVYGDYDVDGVSSTVILYKSLKLLGADISYYIPDRYADGYGLNMRAVKKIADSGCGLLITCDNGISAAAEIDYASELGMQTVILDHHEPPYNTDKEGVKQYMLPDADAVIDLKAEGDNYPFTELCAGGLCYKFVRELYTYLGRELTLDDELLVFAALATICDVVELRDENRVIAYCGLEKINKKIDNIGLKKLVEINNMQGKRINEHTFGFVIGPCIKAVGRLDEAAYAAELFISEDVDETERLAEKLYSLNAMRRDMTADSVEKLSYNADKSDDMVLVLYDADVDEGIAGIVASRLKERYNKPVIVLTDSENGVKGSGRSISTYNMIGELTKVSELFTKYGGHKMAAGMSLPAENVDLLREKLNQSCTLTNDDIEPVFTADKIVTLDEISILSAGDMEIFKPCGAGNPEPLFAALGLRISNLRFVGAEKNVVQLTVEDASHNRVSAVWFGADRIIGLINGFYGYDVIDDGHNLKGNIDNIQVDIMANLRVDSYGSLSVPKLNIRDMRISGHN